MRISAKADYAVRAAVELAAAPDERPIKAERIATNQDISLNFLENILGELRHAGIVRSHRGADGGFRLARAADEVTVADVIRAVEGPLATVRGRTPEELGLRRVGLVAVTGMDRGQKERAQRRRACDPRRCREWRAARADREARRGPRGLGDAVNRLRPPSRRA